MDAAAAVAASLAIGAMYVISLYTIPRRLRELPRDHPLHVRYIE
jgi:hypothetical protein